MTNARDIAREEYLFMMECFDACEEAKQNEKRLRAEIKTAREKLERMENNGVCSGADYDTTQEQIVKLTAEISEGWAKYHRMIYGE